VNWAFCNGAVLPVSQNQALYSLIGNTYGGTSPTTFGLPNLQGRVPVGAGTSPFGTQYVLGAVGGAESATLNTNQMPAHTHAVGITQPAFTASGTVTPKAGTGKLTYVSDPTNNYAGQPVAGTNIYTSTTNAVMGSSPVTITVALSTPGTVALQSSGGGLPFKIFPPYQVLNYIIALQGVYPTRP
jgi:microcystin-dependent protein